MKKQVIRVDKELYKIYGSKEIHSRYINHLSAHFNQMSYNIFRILFPTLKINPTLEVYTP